jgi:ubiquinone/menaquinone biosynthesis C-methylase UbiE/uncharacterized protein YbaR (Trm112 family)
MTKTNFHDLIICPNCRKNLSWRNKYAACSKCASKYPIKNEIVCFLNKTDEFYENHYIRQIHYMPRKNFLKNWIFFNLMQSGIIGEIKRNTKPGDFVLDIGCAGGIKWLGTYAQTTGFDISFASLVKAKEFYKNAVQADIETLPFRNNSFDVVYGSYIFEHLLPKSKDDFLKEAYRILKPQGKLILQFDTLSENWLTRYALRDVYAFKKGFIDVDRHIGLEYPSKAVSKIRNSGFKIIKTNKFGTTFFQYEPTYNWLNKAYGQSVFWISFLGKFSKKIAGNKYLGPITEFSITLLDKLMSPILKLNNATRIIVVAEKYEFNH